MNEILCNHSNQQQQQQDDNNDRLLKEKNLVDELTTAK
jgi:hypothetical protein